MTQIKLRRDTSANFTSKNPVLGVGEPAYETDTKKLKIGDGTTAYTQLEYFSTGGGGGSTNISATLPLKIVDGVISLEVDGQTIQIVDGKLHANLDELSNKVNTLTGDVASVQADLLKKQDGLVSASPIEIKKSTGLTVVGTPMSGNDFVMDRMSTTSYCVFPENYLAIGNEYQVKFTTPSSWPSDYMDIFDCGDPLSPQYDYTTGNISVWAPLHGRGFEPVIPSPTLNTTYYIRMKMVTSTQVKTCYSTDGKTFTEWKTTDINPTNAWSKGDRHHVGVGYSPGTSEIVRAWTGTIDLKECYVIANGVKYYMFPDAKTGAIGINLGSGLAIADGKLTANSTAPENMVTTDTAQTITGQKTFTDSLFFDCTKNVTGNLGFRAKFQTGNQVNTAVVFGGQLGQNNNLKFGFSDALLRIIGNPIQFSKIPTLLSDGKKFLTQSSVTGTDNITVTETTDGIQIICNAPTNAQFTTLQDVVATKANTNHVWTLSTVGNISTPLSWGASGSKYVAPANGRFFIEAQLNNSNDYIRLYCSKNSINRICTGNAAGVAVLDISVDKGDEVALYHNINVQPTHFNFIKANGD